MRPNHKKLSAARRTLCVAMVACLPFLTGCQTSSDNIDLTERGVLSLVITQVSGSSIATATATVTDSSILSLPFTGITLADDQLIYVNDIPLTATMLTVLGLDGTVGATIEAVDSSDEYEIEFDNQGDISICEISPPEDFDDVTPENGDDVSVDGFDIEWDASDDDDATITVTISGTGYSYAEDGTLQTAPIEVTLSDLSDDGELTIGSTQLAQFLTGDIIVKMTREKEVSKKLGFASGTIYFEITKTISLDLVEDD